MYASLALSFPAISPPLAPRAWIHRPTLSLLTLARSPLQTGHGRQGLRRRSRSTMSSDHYRVDSVANQRELVDVSDFETVVSPDGLISICGFGSLLSGMYKELAFIMIGVCGLLFFFFKFRSYCQSFCGGQRGARGVHSLV